MASTMGVVREWYYELFLRKCSWSVRIMRVKYTSLTPFIATKFKLFLLAGRLRTRLTTILWNEERLVLFSGSMYRSTDALIQLVQNFVLTSSADLSVMCLFQSGGHHSERGVVSASQLGLPDAVRHLPPCPCGRRRRRRGRGGAGPPRADARVPRRPAAARSHLPHRGRVPGTERGGPRAVQAGAGPAQRR